MKENNKRPSNFTVNIVGAGLAGLSAAVHLAMEGIPCRLISSQPSERAQSVLAEGGINGALNTMGEDDNTENHFHDTMHAGCDIADPEAVRDLTEHAPDVLRWMDSLGVPFQRKGNVIQQRNFGGQKKKRTAYAASSTGKVLMTALIDEARRYEAEGLITRYPHHDFVRLLLADSNNRNVPGAVDGGILNAAGAHNILNASDAHNKNNKAPVQSEISPSIKSASTQNSTAQAGLTDDLPFEKQQFSDRKICTGVLIRDNIFGETMYFAGPVLMACGGFGGLFPGKTTGTTADTGDAAATLFSQGILFSNLEMIQYHPTTLGIPGKRLLVSEAARGEGGRLFIYRMKDRSLSADNEEDAQQSDFSAEKSDPSEGKDSAAVRPAFTRCKGVNTDNPTGEKWYFMEEKYPELGNLMPRDVVSREEYFVAHDPSCGDQVYLDCTGLSREIWQKRLPDLRKEVIYYTKLDPVKDPIPIEPGIHYFMGGIDTDAAHHTNISGLYAAGECCSLYHGANRLGGNSTLGAIYGGQRAARTISEEMNELAELQNPVGLSDVQSGIAEQDSSVPSDTITGSAGNVLSDTPQEEDLNHEALSLRDHDEQLGDILYNALGVVRTEETMSAAAEKLEKILGVSDSSKSASEAAGNSHDGTEQSDSDGPLSDRERARIILGLAILKSAIYRKESRGAQYRSDYPDRNPEYLGTVVAQYDPSEDPADPVKISFRKQIRFSQTPAS